VFLASDGIDGVGFVVLVVVAALAGPSHVFEVVGSAFALWGDVLDSERLHGVARRAPAILATTLSALDDEAPTLGFGELVSHGS